MNRTQLSTSVLAALALPIGSTTISAGATRSAWAMIAPVADAASAPDPPAPGVATDEVRQFRGSDAFDVRWANAVGTLVDWYSNPELLGDDGVEVPDRRTIARALDHLVSQSQVLRLSAPPHVAPTVDGGIALEWQNSSAFLRVAFQNSGEVETLFFKDGKLARSDRQVLQW
jgi:hypothetical protein